MHPNHQHQNLTTNYMPRHQDVGSILTNQRRLLLNLTYVKCPPVSTTFYHWWEMTVRARLTTTHRLKTSLTVNNLASEPDLLQTTRKNDNRSQITLSQPTNQNQHQIHSALPFNWTDETRCSTTPCISGSMRTTNC